jgi:hypothetical protein
MLLGLIFRESAKPYRSFKAWRAEAKGATLPSSIDKRPIFLNSPPVLSHTFSHKEQPFTGPQTTVLRHDSSASDAPSWSSTAKAAYGFGRQGEKVAGMRGFLLQKPEESLPRYVASTPPPAPKSTLSRSVSSTSGASSFYSKDVRRVEEAPPMPQREDDRETDSRSGTPTFKSSQRAL